MCVINVRTHLPGLIAKSSIFINKVALIIIHVTGADDDEKDYLRDEYVLMKSQKSPDEEGESGDDASKAGESDTSGDNYQLTNLTIKWEHLSWKILCDQDEWRSQFAVIRHNFTRCVELSKILLPEDKDKEEDRQKRTWSFMFSDGKSNPYCRLSRNWLNCYQYLTSLTCLDPNPTALETEKGSSSLLPQIEKYLPKYKNKDDWIAMHRPYKMACLLSKVALNASPFGLFGGPFMF